MVDSSVESGILRWAPQLLMLLLSAIIIWSVSTIQQLEIAISRLDAAVELLRDTPIPPPWVEKRLEDLGRELERQQRLMDRLENAIDAKGLELPPYSSTDQRGRFMLTTSSIKGAEE